MAVIQGIFATAHDFVGSLALLLLAAQVYLTARGDDEETVGHFVRPNISYFLRLDFYLPTQAHDAVCATQALTILSEGLNSASTSLVAFSIFLVWFSSGIQVHLMYARPGLGSDDVPYQPATADASIIFSV